MRKIHALLLFFRRFFKKYGCFKPFMYYWLSVDVLIGSIFYLGAFIVNYTKQRIHRALIKPSRLVKHPKQVRYTEPNKAHETLEI